MSDRDITIIDSNLLQKLPVHSISDVISLMPGVDSRRRGDGTVQSDWTSILYGLRIGIANYHSCPV